jgi:hypothetical protein
MNGRALANAGVFACGIFLIVTGGWAVWRGSSYIQLEWGWSSVISGSVALTGGVLTLAIGFVLQRLDALLRVRAGAEVQPRTIPAVSEPGVEAMPLGLVTAPAAHEPAPQPATYADPVPQAVQAINLELLEHEERRPAAAEHEGDPASQKTHDVHATETIASNPPSAVRHAADQGPADDMVKAGGVSDEPELDAAIEELLAGERGKPSPTLPTGEQASLAAELPAETMQETPTPASGEREQTRPRAGWRGLFSRRERRPGIPPPAEGPGVQPLLEGEAPSAIESESAAVPEHAPEDSQAVRPDAIPRTGDDWFDRALSGRDEIYAPATPNAGEAASSGRNSEELGQPRPEAHPPAAEELAASSAPAAESPVIGQYTSGNTTYIMFADGSIEAETPSGILHFASLADLKVYVEGGQ